MSKLSRKEFKELLVEWNNNFLNEFRDTRKRRPERPEDEFFKAFYEFRSWLIKSLKEIQIEEVIGFENFKEKLSIKLKKLSMEPKKNEFGESFFFNTFIEYKGLDLYGDLGKQFLEHVDFSKDENCKEEDFFYVIVSPIPAIGLLASALSSYSHEEDLGNIEERKKFFIAEFFPFFEFEIAYKSTHPEIEEDIQNNYFKLHNAECFIFKNK